MDLLRLAGQTLFPQHRLLGPVLRAVRDPGSVVRAAQEAAGRIMGAQNPLRQTAVEVVSPMASTIRRPMVKATRDFLLSPLDPAKKTFAQVMTGGTASGDPVRQLDTNTLEQVKRAVVGDWRPSNVNPENSIQYNLYARPFEKEMEREAVYTGDYSAIEDLKTAQNTLGSFGAIRRPDGGYLIKDRWKVDEPFAEERYEVYPDLKEGGKLATDIYRFARDTGLYEPIDYRVEIPYEQWSKTRDLPQPRTSRF